MTMAKISPVEFKPDVVSHPGQTIQDILEDIGMSQAELARRMGRPNNKINQIIKGRKEITADTALELAGVLGLPASFWLNREQNYQLAISEEKLLNDQKKDCVKAKDFPCAEMARYGWIEKRNTWLEKYQELLRFFGTAKLDALEEAVDLAPSFRKAGKNKANKEALAAWLRRGFIEAKELEKGEFSKEGTMKKIDILRNLTHQGSDGLTMKLPKLAAELGIAVIFVRHLKGTYVGGAAYWHGNTPVIQLSYRGKRHDIIWFNFFHELGHILLHSKTETYLDDFSSDVSTHEIEANKFAADILIPPESWSDFVEEEDFTEISLNEFSESVGVATSIVAGRLQREELLNPTKLNRYFISIQ